MQALKILLLGEPKNSLVYGLLWAKALNLSPNLTQAETFDANICCPLSMIVP